ncbi:hypothetical protein BGZ57DRAFT_940452 [Hyaloscypha finlandica]|nr:hypothetical protein BGZ57DRAFT_940452 [Hyaloscypha finlandica]
MNIQLPHPDPLQTPLQGLSRQSLGPLCKLAILHGFWSRSDPSFDHTILPLDTYFEHFEQQCRLALHNWGRHDVSSLKLSHLVDLAQMIRQGTSRAEMDSHLISILEGHCQEVSGEIIDLTALAPGQVSLVWADGPLPKSLAAYFNNHIVLKDSVELDRTFTARNIERIGGIRIVWTSNLIDHLRMRDDRSVALFHHAAYLHYRKDCCDIYPECLLQETINTLSLLLPIDQRDTKNWFLKKQIELHLDNEATRCRPLTADERKIDKFEFWRDRLVILKQAFDDAKPRTFRQAWLDRRNPTQWYSFWIAGLFLIGFTILLGNIQCMEGVLQVYKAYHPT